MSNRAELSRIASLQSLLDKAKGNLNRIVEVFEHLESGVVLYGPDDCLVFCNRRFREIYREVADLLLPGTRYADIARAFYQRGFEHRTKLDEENYIRTRVAKHLDPDEQDYEWLLKNDIWLLVSDRKTADGGVIGFCLDISARKQAEEKLAQSEQRLKSLLEMSSDWYWEQDENFLFTHISDGMQRSTGVDPVERYGRPRWDIPYLGIAREQMDEHRRRVEAHESFRDFQYAYNKPDGNIYWGSVSGEPVFDVRGVFTGYRGVGSDITEKKRTETRIRELAEYDFLTGLPNRMLLSVPSILPCASQTGIVADFRCFSSTWTDSRISMIRWATTLAIKSLWRPPTVSLRQCDPPIRFHGTVAMNSSCYSPVSLPSRTSPTSPT